VGTRRRDALQGRDQHLARDGPGEAATVLDHLGQDALAGNTTGDEDDLADMVSDGFAAVSHRFQVESK
jgi:hypothetical protein